MERRDGPAERHRARSATAAAQTESGPARARQSAALRGGKKKSGGGRGRGRKIKGERGEGGKGGKARRRGRETRIVLREPRPPRGGGIRAAFRRPIGRPARRSAVGKQAAVSRPPHRRLLLSVTAAVRRFQAPRGPPRAGGEKNAPPHPPGR